MQETDGHLNTEIILGKMRLTCPKLDGSVKVSQPKLLIFIEPTFAIRKQQCKENGQQHNEWKLLAAGRI